MRIAYKAKYDLTKPCVAKLWFGKHYLIVKSGDIKAYSRNFIDLVQESSYASVAVRTFVKSRLLRIIKMEVVRTCTVEILLSTRRGEDLLAKEQAALNQRDQWCDNRNRMADRPSWINELISARPITPGLFRLKGKHRAAPAVVKLWVGGKFFVWKCKNIQVFPEVFNRAIADNIDKYDPESGDRLNPLVEYIIANNIEGGFIEVCYKLAAGEGPDELLAYEKDLLKQFVGKKICLNRSIKPYKPKWIHTQLQEQ